MNVIVFITHLTLTEDHANLCFQALSNSEDPVSIERLYIYNVNPQLETSRILEIIQRYDLSFIRDVVVIPSEETSSLKTLGGDIQAISKAIEKREDPQTNVTFLKSEMCVSKYVLSELKRFQGKDVVFVPPLLNAKKSVTNDEIISKCLLPYMIFSSDDTFFMEDENQSKENDFRDRPEDAYSSKIRYLSTTCKRDWSFHTITCRLLSKIVLRSQQWGGCNFDQLKPYWVGAYKSFTVHKYHPIRSVNCEMERPDDYGRWLDS